MIPRGVGAPSRRGTPIRRIQGADIGNAAYAPGIAPWGRDREGVSPSRQRSSGVTSMIPTNCISKQIVNSNYTVFALEDLSKIRVQKRRGTDFNRKLNNWSFYELEQFLRYKAEALG
jgi:IS605 OrfB family transposase